MKAAIIGLPKTGKTTIFNALTRSEHNTDKYAPASLEANMELCKLLMKELISSPSSINLKLSTPQLNITIIPGFLQGE